MTKERNKLYIACENVDFIWSDKDIRIFKRMWNDGKPFLDICKRLGRPQKDVQMLMIDLAEKDQIKQRKRGLM